MKVIHIIPAAFDYFDDIRARAFDLVEKQNKNGIEADAFTLQYGGTPKTDRVQIRESAPHQNYQGLIGLDNLFASLRDYDIVHLHCPFMGAAGKILKWKQANPNRVLVITYHRDVGLPDLFSFIIRWYNRHYLPKIFLAADVVLCSDPDRFKKSSGAKFLPDLGKVVPIVDNADFYLTLYLKYAKINQSK